jgi:hypothetical protein
VTLTWPGCALFLRLRLNTDIISVVKNAEVKIKISAEVRIIIIREIKKAGLTVRVFKRFKIRVRFSGKS